MLQRLRVQPCLAALPAADLIASGCRTCEGCEQGGAASEAGNVPKQHFAWEPTLLHLQLANAQRAQLFGVLWGRGVWARECGRRPDQVRPRCQCQSQPSYSKGDFHDPLGCEELEACEVTPPAQKATHFVASGQELFSKFASFGEHTFYMLYHGSLHSVQSFEARHHEV